MRVAARVIAASVLTLASACGALEESPPRSPLGRESTPAAVTATPLASPTAVVSSPGAPAAPIDVETATGLAIEMLAEWLGVPATQLAPLDSEATTWPNACLGLTRPGVACAEVETPGFRVVLLDAFDDQHELRLDAGGRGVWAPRDVFVGPIVALDPAGGTVTLTGEGEEFTLRVAPGTRWVVGPAGSGLRALSLGDTVEAQYDPAANGERLPVIVWLAVLE